MRHVMMIVTLFAIATGFYAVWVHQHRATISLANAPMGAAQIGGAFSLTDQNGKIFSSTELQGKWALVFFGFSHCPDECPLALSNMTAALNTLGNTGQDVVPVFISVDPARDTPKVLKKYAANFHPRLVALTGKPEVIEEVKQAYKVYAAKAEAEKKGQKEYNVSHSAFIYLMGPDGKYVQHFSNDIAPDALAEGVRGALRIAGNK